MKLKRGMAELLKLRESEIYYLFFLGTMGQYYMFRIIIFILCLDFFLNERFFKSEVIIDFITLCNIHTYF